MSGSTALSSSFKVLPYPYEDKSWGAFPFDPDNESVYEDKSWSAEPFNPDTPRGFSDGRQPQPNRFQIRNTLVNVIRPLGPIAKTDYIISGVTRDSGGNILGGCTVRLIPVDGRGKVQEVTSDANGSFSFYVRDNLTQFFIDAYKAGTPDVMGSTERNRTGETV